MHILLPGYPRDNPILHGVAALLSGIPLEEVLEARDRALPSPLDFAKASLEAVRWLPAQSPLVDGLLAQSLQAFRAMAPEDQDRLLEQARAVAQEGAGHAAALAAQWEAAGT